MMMLQQVLQTAAVVFLVMTSCCSTMTSAAPTGVEPADTEKQGCADPQPLKHGVFQVEFDQSAVEYTCQPGYSLVGSPTATCLTDGQWSSESPICLGFDCPAMRVRRATVTSRFRGGLVRVKCRRGYRLDGPELLACIDGQWNSTSLPTCVAESSPQRKHKKNDVDSAFDDAALSAAAAADASAATAPESAAEFGATDAVEGRAKMSHDQWLELSDYTCIRSEQTVAPPSVRNARYTTQWALHGELPRLYATYQCNWGYVSSGARTVYCRKGHWVGNTPTCVYFNNSDDDMLQSDVGGSADPLGHDELLRQADYTCVGPTPADSVEPPSPEHSVTSLKFSIVDGRPHLYARYTCQAGFGLRDPTRNHMYCKRNAWIGTMPTCVDESQLANTCLMNNGGCQHLCTSQSGLASCSCKPGFMLADDRHTCIDIDECEVNNGECHQICDNVDGGFSCNCYDGYQFNDDRTTCISIDDRK